MITESTATTISAPTAMINGNGTSNGAGVQRGGGDPGTVRAEPAPNPMR